MTFVVGSINRRSEPFLALVILRQTRGQGQLEPQPRHLSVSTFKHLSPSTGFGVAVPNILLSALHTRYLPRVLPRVLPRYQCGLEPLI
ncbi:hypothetical protein LZ31DRAFT_277169 [Colletotrichum somersetense]|nr:hypothetical protein LZ31DRAFT_277169 [Colletotrichum somersetense]